MKAKLILLLPLVHILMAGAVIGFEEFRYWRLYPDFIERASRIEREDRKHHTIQSKAAEEQNAIFKESIAMEFRPSAATRSIYGVELPAAVVFGWFFHPISTKFGGFLYSRLLDLTLEMPAVSKVLLLDGLLILAIGTQWWAVGLWLRARERGNESAEFQRKLAIAITIGGVVSMSLCHAGGEWEFIAVLASFGSAILWLVLLSNAALAVGTSAWTFLRRSVATSGQS